MTISIARPHGTDIVRGDLRAAVQPADVWDINSTRTPRRHAGNVRTLADSDRLRWACCWELGFLLALHSGALSPVGRLTQLTQQLMVPWPA